ncbi:MAG: class I SAM-dependent methyltransferase [Planctomycetes bacterium]|nr:class I SAM-dependent methyltransferase [Planctomycetota bacterium]
MSVATAVPREVRAWWDANPMTYGPVHGGSHGAVPGSEAFFREADRAFLRQARFASGGGVLLGDLVDYARWAGRDVLEVGCGIGAVAQRFVEAGARLTAVDLTATAVAQTCRRLLGTGRRARVYQADAERLPFATGRFDAVFSWGVLHHTPGIARAVAEVHRVLRPGGEAMVMLYHRHSLRFWLDKWLWEGVVHGENRFLDRDALTSRYSDGWEEAGNPHTRTFSRREARRLFEAFEAVRVEVCGNLQVSYRRYLPGLWRLVPEWLERYWATRVGWFLWVRARKGGVPS